jgi:hypothetical protein
VQENEVAGRGVQPVRQHGAAEGNGESTETAEADAPEIHALRPAPAVTEAAVLDFEVTRSSVPWRRWHRVLTKSVTKTPSAAQNPRVYGVFTEHLRPPN